MQEGRKTVFELGPSLPEYDGLNSCQVLELNVHLPHQRVTLHGSRIPLR